MIIRKGWRRRSKHAGIKMQCYEGIFLLGIIPLYIKRVTVYY